MPDDKPMSTRSIDKAEDKPEPAATATPAAAAASATAEEPVAKAGKCPKTGAKLVPYEGENEHKLGSLVCEACSHRFLPNAVICPQA